MFGFIALVMLRQHDFHQQPKQGWLYLLFIGLIGVVPPLAYAATLKRYRLSIDHEDLRWEQIDGPVLARQPMRTLHWWRVSRVKDGVGETLYLRFRQGDSVSINSMEYARLAELVLFLQARFASKQRVD